MSTSPQPAVYDIAVIGAGPAFNPGKFADKARTAQATIK